MSYAFERLFAVRLTWDSTSASVYFIVDGMKVWVLSKSFDPVVEARPRFTLSLFSRSALAFLTFNASTSSAWSLTPSCERSHFSIEVAIITNLSWAG